MTRVADTASHALMLSNLNRSLESSRDLQVQISTGKVGLEYAVIGRDSQRLVSLEGERVRTGTRLSTEHAHGHGHGHGHAHAHAGVDVGGDERR